MNQNLTRRQFAGAAAAMSLLSFPAARAETGKPGANFDQILEGAKQEGKLTAWIAGPRMPATHQALIAAFNKRFGLGTRLEWVPNPPVTSNTRAITEAAGGEVSVDVIGSSAIEEVAVAVNAKLIKPYPWTEVFGGTFPLMKDMEARVMPQFRGSAIPYQLIAYGIGWNPNAITDADVPEKFTDLGDPKYRGKFAFNSFLAPLEVLSYVLGADATLDLARRIFANNPVMARGTPAVASAITTGEVPFGVTISAVAETLQRTKAPLKFKLCSDVIPVSQLYLYVPDAAPHPNTARLFAAWLAIEGSAVGNPLEPMARPGDPDTTLGRLIADRQATSGAKIAEPKTPADLAASGKLRETLLQLLNGQSK